LCTTQPRGSRGPGLHRQDASRAPGASLCCGSSSYLLQSGLAEQQHQSRLALAPATASRCRNPASQCRNPVSQCCHPTPAPAASPTCEGMTFSSVDQLGMSDMVPLQTTPPSEQKRKRVLRRPPILEDYINVTSTEGTRVFLVQREDCSRTGVEVRGRPLYLLGVPFSYLKEQVYEEVLNLIPTLWPFSAELTPGTEEESASHCLWVDRFTPRRYTELLSDDYTNRCLLKWLKLWDTVVFGKEKPVKKAKPVAEAHPPLKQPKEQQNKWKSKVQLTEEILEAELDQYKRPKYKAALLCGPPGLGKTTLAHVIAKHAGYNVVEMNASDDRSPDAFKTHIEAATQMKSVLGADEKPNCLIIDEIDGAPTASINVLLNIINRKEAEAEAAPGVGRRRRREGGLLLRPIICICNDQYVPSLRPLRQQSFLLSFPQTLPSRLAQRLAEIALKQGMRADMGALLALCEKTENDIRSCINTLQFLHGRGQKELSMQMVQTMKIGLKDQNKGLFSIWQEIFQLPRVQRHRIGMDPALPIEQLGGDEGLLPVGAKPGFNAPSHRFQRILHLATAAGEHEKLAQGLYDNFLNMKMRDSCFGSVCLALEWLEFSDVLGSAVLHGQSFQLLRYLPFLPVAFHLLFAASSIPRLAYPKSQHEVSTGRNLVTALVSGIAPAARSRAGLQVLVLEVLCLLLDIIAPKLRPVRPPLSATLMRVGQRGGFGLMQLSLGQNVEDVCRFPDLPARRQLTYQAKQLIAREIELEKMRRMEALLQERKGGEGHEEGRSGPEHRHQPAPLTLSLCFSLLQPETDFFGRPLVKKAAAPAPASQPDEQDAMEQQLGTAVGRSDVWFRFNEGVSNAVRRNIYIRDLL
uniref:Chromosome transmission fidelity protein 18 homolog n=1 Tax=Nothoprocta perdicaria TaxID=30464 RepID=A0A8C7A2C8_NOTPE